MRTRNFLLSLLILMTTSSVWAQDFTVNIPTFDHDYVVPVDTMSRKLYIGQEFMEWSWEGGLWQLEFSFHNAGPEPIEYTFAGIVHGNFYGDEPDTLGFDITPLSLVDSVWAGVFETANGMATGFRYIDLPGDSISGVSLTFSSESPSYERVYFSMWIKADTVSDWSQFQPLVAGNVWKFNGRRPAYHYERTEIIDMVTAGDTAVYTVAFQREFLPEYGTGIVSDTGRVFTVDSERYRVRGFDGAGVSTLLIDFELVFPPDNPYSFEGLILQADGTVDFSRFDFWGNSTSWRYGIGFDLETGDNIGNITRLIGYRVGDEEWGDIDVLVGIKDEPKLPDEFQLAVYPNPFNPSTTIRYALPENGQVEVTIYDQLGREVKTLIDQSHSAGEYQIQWDGKDDGRRLLGSGLYFCQVRAGDFSRTFKLILLK